MIEDRVAPRYFRPGGALIAMERLFRPVDRSRISTYRRRIREGLEAAFDEELPPTDVASSFSFGLFVAALPNFGLALVLFALLARYIERVSKLALLAAILVMNPPVKWGIYLAGLWLGLHLLGPVPGVSVSSFSVSTLSLSAGPDVFLRVFVGSLVISTAAAVIGYAIALRFIRKLRERDAQLSETLSEVFHE